MLNGVRGFVRCAKAQILVYIQYVAFGPPCGTIESRVYKPHNILGVMQVHMYVHARRKDIRYKYKAPLPLLSYNYGLGHINTEL